MSKLKYIELILENCEVIEIFPENLAFLTIEDIVKNYYLNANMVDDFLVANEISLGIKKDFLFQEVADKKQCLENLQKKLEISWKNCAFIGDDWIDLPILMRCGFSACPADAHNEVKQRVDYICQNNGGKGAVREFVEIILKNQKTDLYQSILNEYLK